MLRLAWRDVRLHPVRFLMSILAVVLGVSFVTGTYAMRAMLSSTFDGIITTSIDGDIYVIVDTGEVPDIALGVLQGQVPLSLAQDVAKVEGVAWTRANLGGPIVLLGKDGQPVNPAGMAGGGAPSSAFAVDPGEEPYVNWSIQGQYPAGENQIVLESATAERAGLARGDTTTVVLGQEPRQVTVTGILAPDEETAFAGAVLVGLSREAAQAAFAPAGTTESMTIWAQGDYSVDQVTKAVKAVLPAGVAAIPADDMRAASKQSIDQILGFVNTFLLVFAAIALFVGSFIIANTFAMVARQRERETAVIRALGASPRQVFASFVGQAAIVGLIGAALGLAGGFGLLTLIKRFFTSIGMTLSGALPVTLGGIAIPVVLGVATACLAAALPAWRASKVPPVDAMRQGVVQTQRSDKVRSWIGLGLMVVGLVLVIVALRQGTDGGPALGVGAAALLLGLTAASPALAPALTRVLAWPFVVLLKPFGKMARRGVVRNPRRTANTAAALLIGTALVGATTVMAASTNASIGDLLDSQMNADFMVQDLSYAPVPLGAIKQIDQTDGAKAYPLGWVPAQVDTGELEDIELGNGPNDSWEAILTLDKFEGSIAAAADSASVSKSYAASAGFKVGDPIKLVLAPKTPFEVELDQTIGMIFDTPALSIDVMLPLDLIEPLFDPVAWEQINQVAQVAVKLEPGASLDLVHQSLNQAVEPYLTLTVMDRAEFSDSIANQATQMLNMIYALLALSVVIAVLGIINTLALSVMERTREIGLMRAVGLGRSQLALITVIEGVLIAVFGTVLGLALGTGLAAALPTVFADIGLVTLVINWGALAGLLVVAALVGMVAALWPAARAARLPVLEAVSYE
ncbi:MAG: FtsX-like permease family protein [Micrococcales bacterium]|nr:FtsX-like permease family protein [Micrococcales bacterium]